VTRVAVGRPAVPAHGIAAVLGALALALALGVTGCARRASEPDPAAAAQERAEKLVKAGNLAYEQGDYRLAARRYAAAAVVNREDAAAYFGMGMALSKLGRDEEARTSYARSRELARKHAALDRTSPNRRSSAASDTIRQHP
jgi:tetratricopeptide (TPR) repeat protein